MSKNNNFVVCTLFFVILTSSVNSLKCRDKNDDHINCHQVYDKVSKCNSEFVNHAMLTSDPFTMCTNGDVFEAYHYTMDYYDKLFTMTEPSNKSVSCSDERLNKNKMNLIVSYVTQTKTLWEAANCDQCYIDPEAKEQNFTAATKEFLQLHFLVSSCMNNTSHNINNSAVCTQCGDDYQKLNILFDHAMEASADKICFDLVDKMNKTRREWSGVYQCCKDKQHSLAAFYSLAASIMMISLSFYCSVYYFGSKHSSNETIDESEVGRRQRAAPSIPAGPSASPSSAAATPQLLINKEDSDDDMLIGEHPMAPKNQDLIVLDK